MQCTNCQFQNMPGSDNCGRCGTSLRLSTAVMDVHPPRASATRKRLRRIVPARQAVIGLRDVMEISGTTSTIHRIAAAAPWSLFLRLAIPGWSHFYTGQRVRGHLFLWGTLIFLVPGLLWLGTTMGSVMLGMAFSVHSSAALDIVTQTFPDAGMRDRIARSILVSVVLGVALYLPIGVLLTRVADPTVINFEMAPFKTGDVLMVNHWAKLQPGHVVMYELATQIIQDPRAGNTAYYTQFTGERIDRILAGPGDRVVWEKGTLKVNGALSGFQPLNPAVVPPKLVVNVPDGHYFILPSTTPFVRADSPESLWLSLCVVPTESIAGRMYARTNPFSRFMIFR